MEKRVLLAFGLSFLMFVVWLRIFPPVPPEPVEPPGGAPVGQPGQFGEMPAPGTDVPEFASGDPVIEEVPEERLEEGAEQVAPVEAVAASREARIVVDTPLYRAVLTNRGAVIESFRLKEFLDSDGEPYEMIPQQGREELGIQPLQLQLEQPKWNREVQEALFESSSARLDVAPGELTEFVLRFADGRGLEVTKTLLVDGSSYEIGVSVSVMRRGEEIAKTVLYGPGVGNESAESRYVGTEKGVIVARGEAHSFDAGDIEGGIDRMELSAVSGRGNGVASHYFTGLMVPKGEGVYGARLAVRGLPEEEGGRKERSFITAALDTRQLSEFSLYIGPKKLEYLDELGPGFRNIVEFGDWMRALAIPLRSGLMAIYDVVGNYGWAIVALTLLINVVLAPLKHYSYTSMRKMQKLAPQVKRIQERYKKLKPTDPRRQEMNKEIMALYQEKKVSPLSGCLPMLLMIPFFFAFYRVLMASIELRQAPFVFWIQDLSVMDPYFVLPIMMGASQLLMQKMTPQTSADPMQAKVMAFMPVIFTFILATAPSGLVLYWFANNLVSMGQQTMTNHYLKEREAKQEAQEAAEKKKSKKSAKRSRDRDGRVKELSRKE